MKKLNHPQVASSTRYFWLSFSILAVFAILPVFFFLKAYQSQNGYIVADLDRYKTILDKHRAIKQKVDSLYYQLSLLNTGKVENDLFLEKYIADNKDGINKAIGVDSVLEFRHYALLMDNIDNMLRLKDTIIGISTKEQLALKDLMECMGKTRKVKQNLSFDPTRSFSSTQK